MNNEYYSHHIKLGVMYQGSENKFQISTCSSWVLNLCLPEVKFINCTDTTPLNKYAASRCDWELGVSLEMRKLLSFSVSVSAQCCIE